jgi:hypothetical protein
MSTITSIDELESIYGQPAEPSLIKEVDHLTPEYIRLIEPPNDDAGHLRPGGTRLYAEG